MSPADTNPESAGEQCVALVNLPVSPPSAPIQSLHTKTLPHIDRTRDHFDFREFDPLFAGGGGGTC